MQDYSTWDNERSWCEWNLNGSIRGRVALMSSRTCGQTACSTGRHMSMSRGVVGSTITHMTMGSYSIHTCTFRAVGVQQDEQAT